MATIIIKSVCYDNFPHQIYRELTFKPDHNLVRTHLAQYTTSAPITVPFVGQDAAEEAFDLTNNPQRQIERLEKYGRGKSVSVGDVVEVDGVNYLCESFGWDVI